MNSPKARVKVYMKICIRGEHEFPCQAIHRQKRVTAKHYENMSMQYTAIFHGSKNEKF